MCHPHYDKAMINNGNWKQALAIGDDIAEAATEYLDRAYFLMHEIARSPSVYYTNADTIARARVGLATARRRLAYVAGSGASAAIAGQHIENVRAYHG